MSPTEREIMHNRWWNDARAILALLAVVGAFTQQAMITIATINKGNTSVSDILSIPTWQAATVSAIVGFYFGARGGGDVIENRTLNRETHDLVNGRHTEALRRQTQLAAALTEAGIPIPPDPGPTKGA